MLDWKSDTRLVVDDVSFVLAPTAIQAGRDAATQTGSLLLRKARWMVEQYAALRAGGAAINVVELGIWDGGSTALLALLFRPKRLVSVELSPARVLALDAFVDAHDLDDVVHVHFGVDQSDRPSLEAITSEEFGSAPLDLVVDDASHLLDQTTASFNVLFPRLRPGGLFVIEDWSWQHISDDAVARALVATDAARAMLVKKLESPEPGSDTGALSRLALELVLTAGYASGVVADLTIRKGWIVVRRGVDELDPATFDIRESYGSLGRAILGRSS